MGFGMHHVRHRLNAAARRARRVTGAVDRGITTAAQAAIRTAQTVDHAVSRTRPLYAGARPVLHHLGVDTSHVDRALNQYDSIRRAVVGR
jgi:hypothetical protein